MDWMELLKCSVLGIIQGLTEFLPVSSDGHLSLFAKFFPSSGSNLMLFVLLHLGTMFAILIIFWKDIWRLFLSLFTIPQAIKDKKLSDDLKMVLYIIVASIPTAIGGLLLKDYFEGLSANLIIVGLFFIVTAAFLISTMFVMPGARKESNFGSGRTLIVGLAQTLAILPGVSRSGTTISTAIWLGADREFAGRLSFLVALPAIFAANVLELKDAFTGGTPMVGGIVAAVPAIVGFLLAFGVGLIALKLLLGLIKNGKFYVFGFYCFAIGILSIILGATGIVK